jgi:hypothetical protein
MIATSKVMGLAERLKTPCEKEGKQKVIERIYHAGVYTMIIPLRSSEVFMVVQYDWSI